MPEKFIEALECGNIVAIDWSSIEEMLGEKPARLHTCSICINEDCFPPKGTYSTSLTEEQIKEILHRGNIQYMAETYKQRTFCQSIEARFFATAKPLVGPWIHNPNCAE